MTRYWGLLILALLIVDPVEACEKYRRNVQDDKGNALAGATVNVYVAGTTTRATLYQDGCNTPIANPLFSGPDSIIEFYVKGGMYDITIAHPAVLSVRGVSNLRIYPPISDNIVSLADYTTADITAVSVGALDQLGANTKTLLIDTAATATLTKTCPATLTLIFVGIGMLTTEAALTMECRVINLTDHDVLLTTGAGSYTMSPGSAGQKQIGTTFSTLGAQSNGTTVYCSDCTFANPCAGSGTGAIAKRLNGAWRCD